MKDRVQVFAYAFPADPSATKDVTVLAEDGQQAYVTAMASHAKSAQELAAHMALPFSRSTSTSLIDMTSFRKKLVFSVKHLSQDPADRIAQLDLRMQLNTATDYEFLTWDRIVTQYSTVELGSISVNGTNTFSFTPKADLSGDIHGSMEGTFSKAAALTESANLAKRFIEVNGSLSNDEAHLTLNGMPGRDLAGNIVAEVTMRAKNSTNYSILSIGGLFQADGTPNTHDKVDLGEIWLRLPEQRKALSGKVCFDACIRDVVGRARTIAEGDDRVIMHCAFDLDGKQSIKVVTGDEFDVKLYYLMDRTTPNFLGIELDGPGSAPVPLAFRSLDQAVALRRWLAASSSTQLQGMAIKWVDNATITAYQATDVNRIAIVEQSLQPASERK